jgi:hypothetical protein
MYWMDRLPLDWMEGERKHFVNLKQKKTKKLETPNECPDRKLEHVDSDTGVVVSGPGGWSASESSGSGSIAKESAEGSSSEVSCNRA